ncbi:hypothetical protein [Streptomyces ipomoeae]|uniref:hypothetical protein n=1 Tax=Streptomyces ipomoeae TaxID=103232 RepID=UPI0029A5F159|nr:hypothetical protein [Streptomyces ipomoeae]MDX2700338.1 hypothetical protein [Streptomyces ipomoeae]MDX2845962.1 hypothetical protein [Streptomyces ipomoeae]
MRPRLPEVSEKQRKAKLAWNKGLTGPSRGAADLPVVQACTVDGCGTAATGPAPAGLVPVAGSKDGAPAHWYCAGRCAAIARARADIIAATLRKPKFRRPHVGHELRGSIVQLRGLNSDVMWSATVPQIAEAIDEALTREEKDTRGGGQPSGAASTARAEILTALQKAGHTPRKAAELLARADREPRDPDPSPDFRETLGGGHALVVEYGDCELIGSCQCGKPFGRTTSDASADTFIRPWEHHTNTEVA